MAQDIELAEKALRYTEGLLRRVEAGQYGLPTPCAEFDVAALVRHMVAGNPYYAGLARGGDPDFSLFARDLAGGRQPGEVFAEGADEVLGVWRTPGAVERRMPLPGGGVGPRVLDLQLLENVLHGWDLATATGQDRAGDADAVRAVRERWYGRFPDGTRERTRLFAPSRPAPADATPLEELAAYFGRTV